MIYIKMLTKILQYQKQIGMPLKLHGTFQHHPFHCKVSTIAEAFEQWRAECMTNALTSQKANEEKLNRIFI